jgi:DNA-binding transcriptional LysR family regulator
MIGMHELNTTRADLNLLSVFNAIAQTGSVSAAAELLSLSQPAVSHALNRLRKQTGDPLFVRGGGGLLATPRALDMRKSAEQVILSAQTLLMPASFDPLSDARSFKIASSDYSTMTLVPPLLRSVRKKAPNCTIELANIGASTLRQLESGDVHCSFWGIEPPASPFNSIKLFDERLAGIMCGTHPLAEMARRGSVGLDQYLAFPHAVVSYGVSSGNPVDTALNAQGLNRQVRYVGQSFAGNLNAISGTNLIMSLPSRLLPHAASMGFVSFELPVSVAPYPFSLIWHARTEADAALRWLRGEIAGVGAIEQIESWPKVKTAF